MRFVLDTGARFNIIRRGSLPPDWDAEVYFEAIDPRLSDANGNPLTLGESVWLTVRFGNTTFKVNFIVADRLAVDVIIGTSFLNHHVIAIKCADQKVQLREGTIPIAQKHQGHTSDYESPGTVNKRAEALTERAGTYGQLGGAAGRSTPKEHMRLVRVRLDRAQPSVHTANQR